MSSLLTRTLNAINISKMENILELIAAEAAGDPRLKENFGISKRDALKMARDLITEQLKKDKDGLLKMYSEIAEIVNR